MVINVHAGHNTRAPGASGLLNEVAEDRRVKDLVIAKLRALGHTVYDCTDDAGATPSACLRNIVAKCNAHKADLDVSIHFNSGANDPGGNGKTTGTEVLVYQAGNAASGYAAKIAAAIAALGYRNRGVKARPDLYVLKHTKAPALLVECCFVDDADDVRLYDPDKMAAAIVQGITGQAASATTAAQTAANDAASSAATSTLVVDGSIGPATVKRWQAVEGTTQDGKISGQNGACKKYYTAISSSVCAWSGGASALVKAVQRRVGVTADGVLGPATAKALQKYLGVTADGYFGTNSAKALQTWLNNN